MKQGDIYIADLNPSKGSEQSGKRPVVIISGPSMNENFNIVIICPLSSAVKNYESCLTLSASKQNGLTIDSEILTFQIRTLSKMRLKNRIGKISTKELTRIFSGLSDILRY